MEFIKGFDEATGTVTALDTEYEGSMVFEPTKGTTKIKIIGTAACRFGNVLKVDLSKTEVDTIKTQAFEACYKLEEVILPESLITIGLNAFNHVNITSITIPKNVQHMDEGSWNQISSINCFIVDEENPFFMSESCFMYNKDQTTLVRAPAYVRRSSDIPNIQNIDTIGSFAFTSTDLQYFEATSKLSTIKIYSFHVTHNAIKVNLTLSQITVITSYSFSGCYAKEILLPGTVTKI